MIRICEASYPRCPAYMRFLSPTVKIVSGEHLDRHYSTMHELTLEIISRFSPVCIITDRWINQNYPWFVLYEAVYSTTYINWHLPRWRYRGRPRMIYSWCQITWSLGSKGISEERMPHAKFDLILHRQPQWIHRYSRLPCRNCLRVLQTYPADSLGLCMPSSAQSRPGDRWD